MNHLTAAVAVATALSLGGPPAAAAGMMQLKVKVPPPAAAPLDAHGFATFRNDDITPRGLLVTNTGLTSQIRAGLDLDKEKKGFINDVSVTGGSDDGSAQQDAGVVATGLQGKRAIDSIIPQRLGSWYVKAGARYDHIINDALLAAQDFTGSAGGGSNFAGTFPKSHREVGVAFVGTGFCCGEKLRAGAPPAQMPV
jgi:hypothetical protein